MSAAHTQVARAMAYAFARNVASMQAAYIEWTRGDGADHGMAWISNTLCGPGLLPGAGTATAQEFFDCEMEKLDKLYPDVTMNPALPSPSWCASVDAELAATAEADAVGMPWPTQSQKLYLEIAHATIAWGEPAKVYAALGAVSLEKITSIEEQFNEMIADEIFNQGEGIYLVSVDWEEAQYEDGRLVFSGYWEIEVIDFQSFDELEKAEASTILPATAVAEGAQLDGESLEPSE